MLADIQAAKNYLRRAAYCGPYRYLQVLATKQNADQWSAFLRLVE